MFESTQVSIKIFPFLLLFIYINKNNIYLKSFIFILISHMNYRWETICMCCLPTWLPRQERIKETPNISQSFRTVGSYSRPYTNSNFIPYFCIFIFIIYHSNDGFKYTETTNAAANTAATSDENNHHSTTSPRAATTNHSFANTIKGKSYN